jgi:hypothetical protein
MIERRSVPKKFKLHRTVLNWLSVSYGGKEKFWQNIKRDYDTDKLDCHEVRLKE